jgi:hypothetical protein
MFQLVWNHLSAWQFSPSFVDIWINPFSFSAILTPILITEEAL